MRVDSTDETGKHKHSKMSPRIRGQGGRDTASPRRSGKGLKGTARQIGSGIGMVAKGAGSGFMKVSGGTVKGVVMVGKASVHGINKMGTALSAGVKQPHRDQTPHLAEKLVVGYLNKMSDGKWQKNTWHQRWFVLDKESCTLFYYKSKPNKKQLNKQMTTGGGQTSPYGKGRTRHASLLTPTGTGGYLFPDSGTTTPNILSPSSASPLLLSSDNFASSSSVGGGSVGPGSDKMQSKPRGVIDLNHRNACLLFEQQLAEGAPTEYYFQVSITDSDEEDSKHTSQLKLCADTEEEFHVWTNAIADCLNKKHANGTETAAISGNVYTHQQLLARRQQSEVQELQNNEAQRSLPNSPPGSPEKRAIVPGSPRRVGPVKKGSDWKFEFRVQVDGKRKCLTFLALANLWTIISFYDVETKRLALYLLFVNLLFRFHLDTSARAPGIVGASTESESSDKASTTQRKVSVAAELDIPTLNIGRSLQRGEGNDTEVNVYCDAEASVFNLRVGPDYRKNRKKQPSLPALLDLVCVEVIKTDFKLEKICDKLNIKNLPFKGYDPANPPRLFIINAQVPTYPPPNPLWGEKQDDGPGISLLMIWAFPPAVEQALLDPQTPELKLLKKFLESDNDPSIHDRFKVIAKIMNPDSGKIGGGLKKLVDNYNAQPVLTRPQHTIYNEKKYTEVDVDIHRFSYIARKGVHGLMAMTNELIIDMCVLMEGITDDELPERALGTCRYQKIDLSNPKDLSFFASNGVGNGSASTAAGSSAKFAAAPPTNPNAEAIVPPLNQ